MVTLRREWLDPKHWVTYPARVKARHEIRLLRDKVDELFESMGPVRHEPSQRVLLADGMYNSPNHYFRLRLFMEALARTEGFRPVGVLRNKNEHTAMRSLRALGFQEFVFLEDGNFAASDFTQQARDLLRGVKCHWDLLSLDLPHGLPAYIYYDTVLHIARHPQPPLNSPLWEKCLCELLRNLAVYADFFDRNDVAHMPFSHPWKSEYGTGVWIAATCGVPAYHLTAFYESLRVCRFLSVEDFKRPFEKLTYQEFLNLPPAVRETFSQAGRSYLKHRASGNTTDINASRAFIPQARKSDRPAARRSLGVQDDRPVVIIYTHAWYDIPHALGTHNFTDFSDWITTTLQIITPIDDTVWLIKPHPLESWYGRFRSGDLIADTPPHIRVLPERTDSHTALVAADAVVTMFGSIGFEAAAMGVPVIAADRGYYSDWEFTHEAENRDDYARLLSEASLLPTPTATKRDAACAFAYLATAPHPPEAGLFTQICDSEGVSLHRDLLKSIRFDDPCIIAELDSLADWLQSGSSAYSVYVKLQNALRQNDLAKVAACP